MSWIHRHEETLNEQLLREADDADHESAAEALFADDTVDAEPRPSRDMESSENVLFAPRAPGSVPRPAGNDMPDEPAVEISDDAAALIREKGGSVYVWIDGAGMRHVHPHPPHHDANRSWTRLQTDGIELLVDPEIEAPPTWVVVLHHLPYRHVDALWNGTSLGTAGVSSGRW